MILWSLEKNQFLLYGSFQRNYLTYCIETVNILKSFWHFRTLVSVSVTFKFKSKISWKFFGFKISF